MLQVNALALPPIPSATGQTPSSLLYLFLLFSLSSFLLFSLSFCLRCGALQLLGHSTSVSPETLRCG